MTDETPDAPDAGGSFGPAAGAAGTSEPGGEPASALAPVVRPLSLGSFFAALLICVSCDHAAKHAAGVLLSGREPIALAGDVVRFQLASNPGAFMSMGSGLPEEVRHVLFALLVPVLLATVTIYFLRAARPSRAERIALGLVVGGGLGNWLDRLLHDGAVRDFVSLGVGPIRTGIFNLADVAVMGGVAVLLLLARRRARAESTP